MPRENTHLLFSDNVYKRIKNQKLKAVIEKNKKYYYFGSVLPDSFYYSKKENIILISDYFHSKDGNLTNEIIFEWLDLIKKNKNEKELVLVFGVLTHYAIDSTFHPVVYYLSGNYHDKDSQKRHEAVYLHRQLETSLDNKINKKFDINKIIKISDLNLNKMQSLKIVSDKFKISLNLLIKDIKRQFFFNKLFKSRIVFGLFYLLYKIGLFKKKEDLSLFYGNLSKDKTIMKDMIDYRDMFSGEAKNTNLKALFKDSEELALEMINNAFSYYFGEISRQDCAKIIDGRSLNTGKIGVSVNEIKFTKFS